MIKGMFQMTREVRGFDLLYRTTFGEKIKLVPYLYAYTKNKSQVE